MLTQGGFDGRHRLLEAPRVAQVPGKTESGLANWLALVDGRRQPLEGSACAEYGGVVLCLGQERERDAAAPMVSSPLIEGTSETGIRALKVGNNNLARPCLLVRLGIPLALVARIGQPPSSRFAGGHIHM